MPTKLLPRTRGKATPPAVPLTERSDTELLQRFVRLEENAAFTVLVQRHGPLVLGVCQRILQHAHDAEDAFQATFLILARKAHTIHGHQSLASWLYKVAFRLALRLRARQARRQAGERQMWDRSAPAVSEPQDWELQLLLTQEVHNLPEKYRAAVVLCYLQGCTNEEAARRLNCPTGTVKIRLLRAREMLRKRLLRQGIGLTVVAVLSSWAEAAPAAPTPELLNSAGQLGTAVLARQPLSALGLPERIRHLSESWLRRRAVVKVKVACAVLLTALLLVLTDRLAHCAWNVTPVTLSKTLPLLELPLSPSYPQSEPELEERPAADLVSLRGQQLPR